MDLFRCVTLVIYSTVTITILGIVHHPVEHFKAGLRRAIS
jgi:hypothetical protein